MLKAIGSKKNLTENSFYELVKDILDNESVMELEKFTHHYGTTRLQHSINVAYYNYLLCKFFHFDERSAARGGMLHDLFHYNRKEYVRQKGERFHNSRHPLIALKNADSEFDINNIERDIILKHMWPVTLALPSHKETVVIVLVDKYCSILEISSFYLSKLKHRIPAEAV